MSDSSTRESGPHSHLRVICGEDGNEWRIFERRHGSYDRRRRLSLLFWSDVAIRRIGLFPNDWWTLSDDALMTLSWST